MFDIINHVLSCLKSPVIDVLAAYIHQVCSRVDVTVVSALYHRCELEIYVYNLYIS